ncbi:MAG TPA: phosphatidate cytidylyltransferase [Gammaproteobacteria bacterium]
MLKQRIITALILAPLAIWAILGLSHELFRLLMMVVAAMAAWEWARLVGWHSLPGRLAYVGLVTGAILVLELLLRQGSAVDGVLIAALGWWLLSLLMVVRYPAGREFWRSHTSARAVAGLLVIVPMWLGVALIHIAPGPAYVLVLMLLVWGADTGAYFAGRRFGRHKLAPHVSPGKSWEGVVGGLLMTFAVAAVGSWLLQPAMGALLFILLSLLTVAFSIVGDLQESMFKRMVELKDSGGLLPGHGGMLDRIDSLTSAAPFFALGVAWLNG